MKSNTLFLIFSLMSVVFSLQTLRAESHAQTQSSRQLVKLDIQNMTCAMCKITIKKALQAVNGVQNVNVNYDSKTTTVLFDPQKTTTGALIEATTNTGYPATIRQP